MMGNVFLYVQLLLAVVMIWSCLCRLTKTDATTEREVRWAFVFQFATAGLLLGAPFLPELMPHQAHWAPLTTPPAIWLLFTLSVALVQVITARHWVHGYPPIYRKTMTRPPRFPFTGAAAGACAALLVGLMVAGPNVSLAQAVKAEFQPVDGDVIFMRKTDELKCINDRGCYGLTAEALAALLKKAGGTCGAIPALPSAEPRRL